MSSDPLQDPLKAPSRKAGKEREPVTTDLAARLVALQRRNAATTRPRERPERMAVPTPTPTVTSRRDKSPKPTPSRPSASSPRKHAHSPRLAHAKPPEVEPDDFSRRLRISSPRQTPASKSSHAKLYNPDTDPIPLRRTAEPESFTESDAPSVQIARNPAKSSQRESSSRQLFDPRKDDPVRYLARPTPTTKLSADYVSASSTSTDANSVASSAFTLSSSTDHSSASSALFDTAGKSGHSDSDHVFSAQLKRLYRSITTLEAKVKAEDAEETVDEGRSLLKPDVQDGEEPNKDKWKKQIEEHKQLAETIHIMLRISLTPTIPTSLRNIPQRYNIVPRLWTFAFVNLLESLRRASYQSTLAFEHLQEFIYYAYTFYTGLLEEPNLGSFKSQWLECLGDLARYCMIVAAMIPKDDEKGPALTAAAISKVDPSNSSDSSRPTSEGQVSNAAAARIDDSPSPSIGVAAARLLDLEPEKERWRIIAQRWYAKGLTDTPGSGKLHHHLALLSRDAEGEELRCLYHFVKSMTTLHPFSTSRESVLSVWSPAAQARRSLPDSRAPALFVLLHGMLFTNIQLDDFQPTLARFMERLELDGCEEREWVAMAVINLTAILEYGKSTGVVKRVGEVGTSGDKAAHGVRLLSKRTAPTPAPAPAPAPAAPDEAMDVDNVPTSGTLRNLNQTQQSPVSSEVDIDAETIPHPASFKLAMQLTFTMLTHVLKHPTRKSSPFGRSTLNPYLPVVLTFLATVMKHAQTLEVLERTIPWEELAAFFATVPRSVMTSQELYGGDVVPSTTDSDRWAMLTSGCAPPLPEDWCLRGMQWVGRKVYERGFWKSGEERNAEMEVLDQSEGGDLTDGQIEDDDDDEEGEQGVKKGGGASFNEKRWVRIVRCAVGISGAANGLSWVPGTRDWKVDGALAEKVQRWREEDQAEREAEEKRRLGTRWVDSMDVDDELEGDVLDGSDEDDENDSEHVRELKERRRYLQSILANAQQTSSASLRPRHRPQRTSRKHAAAAASSRPALAIVPGYTILVIDTNILLSSLSMLSSLIESLRWTIIVPLPVIMELDGLSSNPSPQLSDAAHAALAYLSSHIRTHALSLKVQTSKGNFLTSLSVRAEQIDFGVEGSAERSMDDLILKAAIWQDEHWIDRSGMLKGGASEVAGAAVKVVLLSLDRNLRLKARSRQLPAASEVDLASILATGT